MNTIEMMNLVCDDTKWCQKRDNVVCIIMYDMIQIIRNEELLEIASTIQKDYPIDIPKCNENLTNFKIDLMNYL